MKLIKTLRNNWKKTVFAVCATTYGTYWLIERKQTADLLQAYCYEALKYGKDKANPTLPIKRVTIFLNPVANGERGRFLYDNNVAPLLHLSGLDVRLVRLERNSEANEYMAALDLNDTDCIVVAGGNATLNECISGLINRPDSSEFLKKIPIGLIPIGETNQFARKWFMNPLSQKNDQTEVRLLADSAMSIIKGLSMPADLMKITIMPDSMQLPKSDEMEFEKPEEDLMDRGAYSLLKENKIYALSNFSAGFVTETDAQIGKYWYFGWLKGHMNRYFTDRYLRRQPIKYEFNYKLKCHGCSECLNETELSAKLNNFINNIEDMVISQPQKLSLMQSFYRKFIGIGNFKVKETNQMKELRLKKIQDFQNLIQKSKTINPSCNKLFDAKLVQSQIEMNINTDPILEGNIVNSEPSGIDSAIVKDVRFNPDDMFLEKRRLVSEFELKKLNLNERGLKFKRPEDNLENYFCVDIDGEIYKLDNRPGHEMKIRVEHTEKAIQLLKHDPELSASIRANFWPRIYMNREHNGDMPAIRPFENFYIRFSKRDDLVPTIKKLFSF